MSYLIVKLLKHIPSVLKCVLGAQKNCLNKAVLLSTQNTCLN